MSATRADPIYPPRARKFILLLFTITGERTHVDLVESCARRSAWCRSRNEQQERLDVRERIASATRGVSHAIILDECIAALLVGGLRSANNRRQRMEHVEIAALSPFYLSPLSRESLEQR